MKNGESWAQTRRVIGSERGRVPDALKFKVQCKRVLINLVLLLGNGHTMRNR